MQKYLWKLKFMFWFLIYKKHWISVTEIRFWANQCYLENHNGECNILTERQSAIEVISWAGK